MSNWKESALDALHRSLYPVPQELNEIDWKGGLSNKTEHTIRVSTINLNQNWQLVEARLKDIVERKIDYTI